MQLGRFAAGIAVSLAFGSVLLADKVKLPETYYEQGLTNLSIGKLDKAEEAFRESLSRDAGDVAGLVGLAEIALRRNDAAKAAEHLQKALGKAPENPGVQTAWARYLYTQKQYQQAEQAIRKAIGLSPRAVASRVDLGDILLRGLRRPKEAVAAYREALRLDPKHAGAHYALGLALIGSDELVGARTELEAAARLAPANPLPSHALGALQVAQGQRPAALESFTEALRRQPSFFPAHLARGDVYLGSGDYAKARAEFAKAGELAPRSAVAQLRLGMACQGGGQIQEAEKAYLSAVSLDPAQSVALNNLAWLAAERKTNLDQALKWALRARELAPTSTQFQDTLGWVYRARGEHQQALAVLQRAAAGDPGNGEILYHLGVVYAEQRNPKAAQEALSKALAAQKDFPGADQARRLLAELRRQ